MLMAAAALPSADALLAPFFRMRAAPRVPGIRTGVGIAPTLATAPCAALPVLGSVLWCPTPALAAAAAAAIDSSLSTSALRIAGRVARMLAALAAAWVGVTLKQAGPAANPERHCAGQPIKCPWPFLLVALPWTELGWRSLKAGFCDWQTWFVIALVLLRLPLPVGW